MYHLMSKKIMKYNLTHRFVGSTHHDEKPKMVKLTLIFCGEKYFLEVPKNFKEKYLALAIDKDGEITLYEKPPKKSVDSWYNLPGTNWLTVGQLETQDGKYPKLENFEYLIGVVDKKINLDIG